MERKGIHQKQKLLYLIKIFSEETDDTHMLTLAQITQMLLDNGVTADRKTLYEDFDELRDFGFDIVKEKIGRNYFYHIGQRDFELPELKLLVDAVQSAKSITDRKSNRLISKLERLVSKYEAKQLNRQVIITGRIKSMNESIYYNVDTLHEAIGADCRIRFKYFQWNVRKEMKLRREGEWYQVSPWALMWDDENYYLVGYDADEDKIKHYRVDKMLKISLIHEPREGREQFRKFNMPRYTRSLFGMYGGEETRVTLEAENRMVGVIIDRFGKDILIVPAGEDHFRTTVSVAVSPQFFGWITALEGGVKIVGPDEVVAQMRDSLRRLSAQYEAETGPAGWDLNDRNIRTMRRDHWTRISSKDVVIRDFAWQDLHGKISLMRINRVTEPFSVDDGEGIVTLADKGYTWVQIAPAGQYFWLTSMFDPEDRLLEIYIDMTDGCVTDADDPYFKDMYLDYVVHVRNGQVMEMDRDELTGMFQNGRITRQQYERTLQEGEKVFRFLRQNHRELEELLISRQQELKQALPETEQG